ncbi:hypothetical protein [Azonexus hydrophilus]|uniref:Uncharacterized protein n=1 Tax=Azonexus hydrophilus TaxID=418702 RepID=A0ABZ2XNA5_9RHOO
MSKFFYAVTRGSKIGNGTAQALIAWLESYINILFPENGIEYWNDNRYAKAPSLKKDALIPETGREDKCVHHVACYVRQGSCEGRIIHVQFVLQDGTHAELTWMKTFGNAEESWAIAEAISDALESILIWREIPEIVDLGKMLPRQYAWHRETSYKLPITMRSTKDSIQITGADGHAFYAQDWKDQGINAKFYVESRVKDWLTVLKNTGATFSHENLAVA